MAKQTRRKYKILFRPGKPLTKVALLAVIILSTVALIAVYGAIRNMEQRMEALRSQAFVEEQEREELRQDIEALGTPESVEKIAGEAFGWYDQDTVFIETNKEK